MVYAVVRTGGKQYRVAPGDLIDVEKLPTYTGATVELPEVLLVSHDGEVTVGSPLVPDAKVVGEVEDQGRGKKLVVFKFKAKTRYRKKTGHRQSYTRLRVKDILIGETSLATPESSPELPKRRRTPSAKTTGEAASAAPESSPEPPKRRRTPSTKATVEATSAAPESSPEPPKRKRTRSTKATVEAASAAPESSPEPPKRRRARSAKATGEASATTARGSKAPRRRRTPKAEEKSNDGS